MPISRSAAKRRVDKATKSLSKTRCLIENTDEHNQVQYVHCLPPATNSSVVEFLEYHWNLERGTLNVESRQNILRLGPKFQYLFENKLFFFLPEPHVINLYYEAATARLSPSQRRASFPKLQEPTYQYRLIAHPYMKRVPIHRQRNDNDNSALKATDFTFHAYPYDDFPVIISHVHPRYVIYNAGQKISRNCRTYLEEYPSLALDILGVKDTYEAWTCAPKYNDPFFETAASPQDIDAESDSNATRKRRAKGKAQKQNIVPNAIKQTKRTKTEQRGKSLLPLQLELSSEIKSPYNPAKHEERIGSPSENWLDEQTLRELDENRPVEKNWETRMAKISRWVDDVMSHCQAFQVLQLPESDPAQAVRSG